MLCDILERYKTFNQPHCWQYEIRKTNLNKDLEELNFSEDYIKSLRISDFDFQYVDKSDKEKCKEIKEFIVKNEYLGSLPNRPTNRYIAIHKETGLLAGAVIMATPNTFSLILGEEYKNKEKLISRGACASWTPKNLASWMIAKATDHMVENTEFRIFSAYADPEAKELGTIYQALNFFYLGQNNGTIKQYMDPNSKSGRWFSDRHLRHKSNYQKYALAIGIDKEQWKSYMNRYSPNWKIIPEEIKKGIKQKEKEYKDSCLVRETKPKHKYILIKGQNRAETKYLQRLFLSLHPGNPFDYPKNRGE